VKMKRLIPLIFMISIPFFLSCQNDIWSQVPPQSVSGINLKTSTSIPVGGTETLYPEILPSAAYDCTLTWISDDTSVATVDSSGTVTGVQSGTANISATSVNGISAVCAVTVATPVSGITLNKSSIVIAKNDTYALIATVVPSTSSNPTVTWTSSNSAAVSVDSFGTVTALADGTSAVITAANYDGTVSSTCAVTVPALSIDANFTITPGKTKVMTPVITPTGTSLSPGWTSADTSVVTVSSGTITAIKKGSSVITAALSTDKSAITATCTVSVNIIASAGKSTGLGNLADSYYNSVAMDSSGNSFCAGIVTGTSDAYFDTMILNGSYSGNNGVITKYDSSNSVSWTRLVVGTVTESAFTCVATDSSGNVYAGGYVNGQNGSIISIYPLTVSIPSGVQAGYAHNYPILVKFDSSGSAQWIDTVFDQTGDASIQSISVNDNGDIFVLTDSTATAMYLSSSVGASPGADRYFDLASIK
jgi:uncharacterized protein YjdB